MRHLSLVLIQNNQQTMLWLRLGKQNDETAHRFKERTHGLANQPFSIVLRFLYFIVQLHAVNMGGYQAKHAK